MVLVDVRRAGRSVMADKDNPPTAPIFTALAAALAAIENGAIEQAEIEWNQTHQMEDGSETTDVLTMTVYRHAQPRFGNLGQPPTPTKE